MGTVVELRFVICIEEVISAEHEDFAMVPVI